VQKSRLAVVIPFRFNGLQFLSASSTASALGPSSERRARAAAWYPAAETASTSLRMEARMEISWMMGQSSVVIPRRVSTEGTGGYWDANDIVPAAGVDEWGAVPNERAVMVSKKFRA